MGTGLKHFFTQYFSLLYSFLVALFVVLFAIKYGSTFVATLEDIEPLSLVASLFAILLALSLQAYAWVIIQNSIEPRVKLKGFDAFFVFFQGYLGRYLPGKVGLVFGRVAVLSKRGCSPQRAAYASLLELFVFLLSFFLLGLLLLTPGLLALSNPSALLLLLAGLVVLPLGLMLFSDHFQSLFVFFQQRLLKSDQALPRLAKRSSVQVAGLASAAALAYGASFSCLLAPEATLFDLAFLLQSAGSYTLGIGIGILAVFSPSGIGVRELAPLFFLQESISGPTLLSLLLFHRFLLIISECALLALSWGASSNKR